MSDDDVDDVGDDGDDGCCEMGVRTANVIRDEHSIGLEGGWSRSNEHITRDVDPWGLLRGCGGKESSDGIDI